MLQNVSQMTTRELRKAIREMTKEANKNIYEYRQTGKTDKRAETLIGQASRYAGTKKGYKGGELGLGLSRKTKTQLQSQYRSLERILKNDLSNLNADKQKQAINRRAYETFKERYGELTEEEYADMFDTFESVKESLKSYGYEDKSYSGLARLYTRTNTEGKRKFADVVKQAQKETKGQGKTPEDVMDRVAEILREDNML